MTFAGTVYNDLTGNGALDPGDPGLKGWTVNLINAITGTTIATTTTKGKGTYSFANIGPGLYTVDGGQPERLVPDSTGQSSGNLFLPGHKRYQCEQS